MKNICNDNLNYYYILNSNKVFKTITLFILLIVLLIILNYVKKYKKNKKRNIILKKTITTLIILVIFLSIPTTIYIMRNILDSKIKDCIEKDRINRLEETTSPDRYINNNDNQEIEEVIEIIEDNGESAKLEQEIEEDPTKENAIYFLNVGPGTDSIIIQDDGKFGLIDTSYESKASVILKQLKKIGAKKLDFIIITHAHKDHVGGYKKIISKIPVDTLYIKIPGNVNSNYIPIYYDIIRMSEEKGITICDVVQEELCKEFLFGNTNIKLYNTNFFNSKGITDVDRSRVENTNSIATLVTINNKKIYLASDIGDYFKKKVETKTAKLVGDIDVYKVSHHGYIIYNNNLVSLSYLKPEYNIITNTRQLSMEAVRRIENTSPDYKKTYYTPEGTVTLHVTNEGEFEFNQ